MARFAICLVRSEKKEEKKIHGIIRVVPWPHASRLFFSGLGSEPRCKINFPYGFGSQ